jgi:hypothetical protein
MVWLGIFVTALLDTVPGVDQKALGIASTSESFILSAGYSPDKGITACIALPQSLQVSSCGLQRKFED